MGGPHILLSPFYPELKVLPGVYLPWMQNTTQSDESIFIWNYVYAQNGKVVNNYLLPSEFAQAEESFS